MTKQKTVTAKDVQYPIDKLTKHYGFKVRVTDIIDTHNTYGIHMSNSNGERAMSFHSYEEAFHGLTNIYDALSLLTANCSKQTCCR